MSAIIVIGSQWGDEGKGKAIDVFSAQADLVIRYQGGSNAGHTLNIKGQKKVLHLIPSGVFHPNVTCIISSGVVLDISTLVLEIQAIKANDKKQILNLLISDAATVLLNYHKILDQAREVQAKATKIGTTGKGIGPAYEDRASRKALLFADLFTNEDTLKTKLKQALAEKKFLIENFYKKPPISVEDSLEEILTLREELRPYRCSDTSAVIYQALKEKKKVLFEGAQGSLLDLLHGTYPYVTSSNTIAGAALVGSGIGPGLIHKVIAITKAYTTRVGEGPFPTECQEEEGAFLQKEGKEWGATTGRTRRCGWLDLPALRYACRINGITQLALMKVDVLSTLKEIPICVAYTLKGQQISEFPQHSLELQACSPEYQILPGWQEDISEIRKYEDLPRACQNYIEFIQKKLQTPVDVISVGASREATICRNQLF